MEPRVTNLYKRIPVLDGWRGVAIILVLITHYQSAVLRHYMFGKRFLDVGQHGVTIFFVLSGYLITSKLLTEESFSLQRFYVRRFFRLMPAAWAYLATLLLLTVFTRFKVVGDDLGSCLLFFRNYVVETTRNTCTEHFWSLSLEEQFYLIWPLLLTALGRKRSVAAAVLGVTSIAVFRIAHWNSFNVPYRMLYSQVRADALIVGCLLAFALEKENVRRWFRNVGPTLFPACLVLFMLDAYYFQELIPLHEAVDIAVMIGITTVNQASVFTRSLQWEHLQTTGIYSYSIYVWQGLLLRYNWGIFGFFALPVVVALSWAFIEKPGIAYGRKVTRRETSPFSLEPARV